MDPLSNLYFFRGRWLAYEERVNPLAKVVVTRGSPFHGHDLVYHTSGYQDGVVDPERLAGFGDGVLKYALSLFLRGTRQLAVDIWELQGTVDLAKAHEG